MAQHPNIFVYRTEDELAMATAKKLIGIMNRAIDDRGICFIALAGGDTPRSVYRLLGAEPLVHQVRWSLVHLFFGDERIVPPDDPQSNFGMVARELLKHLVIPEGNIHRIHGELPAAEAASEYAIEL